MAEKHILRPSFKKLYMILATVLVLAVLFYFIFPAILCSAFACSPETMPIDPSLPGLAVLVFTFLVVASLSAQVFIFQLSRTYYFSAEEVAIEQGLFSKTTRSVPTANIDNLTVRRSIFGRLLGFGDICVDTPGGTGYELVMLHIEINTLNEVVSEMKEHMASYRGGIKRNG
ncbi:MAG: PH domain-containing protein [Candidatus Micrarchaeota archaeon]